MSMRVDKYLVAKYPELSRSKIQKLIKSGNVMIDGKKVKAKYIMKKGEEVHLKLDPTEDFVLEVQNFDLDVLYEDGACFVINKPAGMVVHPGEGGSHIIGTVANFVAAKVDEGVGDSMRPGIVHRLDKDTSGALVVAKTIEGYENLVDQFKDRSVEKVYLVLVVGELEHKEGIIEASIGRSVKNRKKMSVREALGGKAAISKYVVKKGVEILTKRFSYVEVEIKTGRTHQIRVHMEAIGHPVVGDIVYGDRNINKMMKEDVGLERQFLHAWKLKFISPDTGKDVQVVSDLPEDLNEVLTWSQS